MAAAVVHVTELVLRTVGDAHATPSIVTVTGLTNPVPVMLIEVFPVKGPTLGTTLVTVMAVEVVA